MKTEGKHLRKQYRIIQGRAEDDEEGDGLGRLMWGENNGKA